MCKWPCAVHPAASVPTSRWLGGAARQARQADGAPPAARCRRVQGGARRGMKRPVGDPRMWAGQPQSHREAEVLAENAGKLPFAKPSAGTLEARCSGAFVCPASSPIWSSKPFARVHKVPRGPWPTGRAQSLRVSSKVDARNSALANPKVDSKALLLIQPMVKMMRRGLQTSAKRKRELKRA